MQSPFIYAHLVLPVTLHISTLQTSLSHMTHRSLLVQICVALAVALTLQHAQPLLIAVASLHAPLYQQMEHALQEVRHF